MHFGFSAPNSDIIGAHHNLLPFIFRDGFIDTFDREQFNDLSFIFELKESGFQEQKYCHKNFDNSLPLFLNEYIEYHMHLF